jgi:hypothetical protein
MKIIRQRDTDATRFDEQFLSFISAGAPATCERIITMPPVFWAVVRPIGSLQASGELMDKSR